MRYRNASSVERMLCNPFYTGIQVSAKLTQDRPEIYNREQFLKIANTLAQREGIRECIRRFLAELRNGESNWTSLIPIHPCFTQPREGIVTQEEFIEAGATQLRERRMTVDRYFTLIAENLQTLAMPLNRYQGARP